MVGLETYQIHALCSSGERRRLECDPLHVPVVGVICGEHTVDRLRRSRRWPRQKLTVERALVPLVGGEGNVQRMALVPPAQGKSNYKGEDMGGEAQGAVQAFNASRCAGDTKGTCIGVNEGMDSKPKPEDTNNTIFIIMEEFHDFEKIQIRLSRANLHHRLRNWNFQMTITYSNFVQSEHMRCFFDIYKICRCQKTPHMPSLDKI